MQPTVSQAIHEVVQSSKSGRLPLDVRDSALTIARQHGIGADGIWLVEQALLMVGSRAGLGIKIGGDVAIRPARNNPVAYSSGSVVNRRG